MTAEPYPRVYEGTKLDAHVRNPVSRTIIRRITVTGDTELIIEARDEAGLHATVAVTLLPLLPGRRPMARVECTIVPSGETLICADELPIEGIGSTWPQLPHRAIVEAAAAAAAGKEMQRARGLTRARNEFLAILLWIAPNATLSEAAVSALMEGCVNGRSVRRGPDVVYVLEINAGPIADHVADLVRQQLASS